MQYVSWDYRKHSYSNSFAASISEGCRAYSFDETKNSLVKSPHAKSRNQIQNFLLSPSTMFRLPWIQSFIDAECPNKIYGHFHKLFFYFKFFRPFLENWWNKNSILPPWHDMGVFDPHRPQKTTNALLPDPWENFWTWKGEKVVRASLVVALVFSMEKIVLINRITFARNVWMENARWNPQIIFYCTFIETFFISSKFLVNCALMALATSKVGLRPSTVRTPPCPKNWGEDP